MIITYLGEQFFKVTQGDLVLAFNPVSKDSGSKAVSHFGADIAFITTHHPLFQGIEQLSHGEREPFVIDGPGDYEVRQIFIKGSITNASVSNKKYINTAYSFVLENINVVFLGALSDAEIPKDAREVLDDPDILFVPIGGNSAHKGVGLIDAKEAAKLALSLEAKLVIPMSYDENSLKIFLKEMGEENSSVTDKLTLKAKDLEGKEGEVIVLKPS